MSYYAFTRSYDAKIGLSVQISSTRRRRGPCWSCFLCNTTIYGAHSHHWYIILIEDVQDDDEYFVTTKSTPLTPPREIFTSIWSGEGRTPHLQMTSPSSRPLTIHHNNCLVFFCFEVFLTQLQLNIYFRKVWRYIYSHINTIQLEETKQRMFFIYDTWNVFLYYETLYLTN